MSTNNFQERYEALVTAYAQSEDKSSLLVGLRSLLAEATKSNDEAWALCFSARIASEEEQDALSLGILDRLLALGSRYPELLERPPFLSALHNKGFILARLGRNEEAIRAFDEVLSQFGSREDLLLADQAAG